MKKLFVLLMVIILVFAVGCAQKVTVAPEPVPVEEPEPAPVEEPEPAPVEEPEEEESLIVEEPEELDDGYDWDSIPRSEQREIKNIREAMEKAMGKDENYFYRYTGPDQYQYEYWVKGDKLKIQVLEEDQIDKTTIKNVVVLDRSDESAEWYCEHSNMNFCYSGPGPWPAVYAEFYRPTAKEWLSELGPDFRYRYDDTISGVSYSIIDYEKDGRLVRVWIDGWNGFPLQIDFHPDMDSESEPTESYKFEDMDLSVVDDDDVNL